MAAAATMIFMIFVLQKQQQHSNNYLFVLNLNLISFSITILNHFISLSSSTLPIISLKLEFYIICIGFVLNFLFSIHNFLFVWFIWQRQLNLVYFDNNDGIGIDIGLLVSGTAWHTYRGRWRHHHWRHHAINSTIVLICYCC